MSRGQPGLLAVQAPGDTLDDAASLRISNIATTERGWLLGLFAAQTLCIAAPKLPDQLKRVRHTGPPESCAGGAPVRLACAFPVVLLGETIPGSDGRRRWKQVGADDSAQVWGADKQGATVRQARDHEQLSVSVTPGRLVELWSGAAEEEGSRSQDAEASEE